MLDSIDIGNHVVLLVHYVGDHGVIRVRLGEGTGGVVGQAPHVVILVIDPVSALLKKCTIFKNELNQCINLMHLISAIFKKCTN